MDIAQQDTTVYQYCLGGLASSTKKTYQAAIKRFLLFCNKYNIAQPFPVNELLLCRFCAEMAIQGLAPATLKTYLSGIRHAQIMNGFPEPAQVASMPRLKLLQAGVVRERAFGSSTHTAPKPRLPITIQLLSDIVRIWSRDSSSQPHDTAMLWAAATLFLQLLSRGGNHGTISRRIRSTPSSDLGRHFYQRPRLTYLVRRGVPNRV